MHDQNPVATSDRIKPVSNRDNSTIRKFFFDGCIKIGFGFRVYRGGGFVQNKNLQFSTVKYLHEKVLGV